MTNVILFLLFHKYSGSILGIVNSGKQPLALLALPFCEERVGEAMIAIMSYEL
jgi:hypothetical protein